MERVTGVGGVFFKARDPQALRAWYRDKLGVPMEEWGHTFKWADDSAQGSTALSVFSSDTPYFEPSPSQFMINLRVRDLHAMLSQLAASGAEVEGKTKETEFGKFGWVMDPEGNRLELWEPPNGE